MTTPSVTGQLARQIGKKVGVNELKTMEVLMEYHRCIAHCLEQEIPFTMSRFGKFYFQYRKRRVFANYDHDEQFYSDKIHRELCFEPTTGIKKSLHGWVHDLGLSTNKIDELTKLAIKPEEIAKIRRAKVLEEQKKLGFTADLFYDEDKLPEHDKVRLEDEPSAAPTVNELIERLGANLDLD